MCGPYNFVVVPVIINKITTTHGTIIITLMFITLKTETNKKNVNFINIKIIRLSIWANNTIATALANSLNLYEIALHQCKGFYSIPMFHSNICSSINLKNSQSRVKL